MVHAVLPIAVVIGVAFAPVCAHAQGQFSLKSVSVDLPPAKDVDAIVDYLVSTKGVK
jgi:hypothetical protein